MANGHRLERDGRTITSFSSAQVGMHGFLALVTASLITYAAVRGDDRGPGYVAGLVALAIAAIPGTLMFCKWRSEDRPAVTGATVSDRRVADHLPRPVVFLHGLAALATAAIIVALLAVD
jgi:hypothetical protein